MSEEQIYHIDLTPPPEPPTILEELAEWNVNLTWKPYTDSWGDKPTGLWYLTNTYTENMNEDWAIGHLVDDLEDQLTSRDREAATIIINRELEAEDIQLTREAWEPELSLHGDGYRHAGPSVNVKMYGMWSMAREVEKVLDIDFEDIDEDGMIQWEVVEWEMDDFKSQYLPDKYPALDTERFGLFGRCAGHLVYDVYDSDYETWGLTLAEATQLGALWKEMPELVKGVEMQVTARLGGFLLLRLWNKMVDEWREGEEDGKSEALRTNDFRRAAWHQRNLDHETEWFDHLEGEEIIWPIIYKEDE